MSQTNTEEWSDEYLPDTSRRRVLQGIGAGATAGAMYPSLRGIQPAQAQLGGLWDAIRKNSTKYASKALGLASTAARGVAVVGRNHPYLRAITIGGAVLAGGYSVLDRVYDYFTADDNRSTIEANDGDLQAAHISLALSAEQIRDYQTRVLAGTKDQQQLSRNQAMTEGLIDGLEAYEKGVSKTEAQTRGALSARDYFARLQFTLINDWQAIFVRNGGLVDMADLAAQKNNRSLLQVRNYQNNSGDSFDAYVDVDRFVQNTDATYDDIDAMSVIVDSETNRLKRIYRDSRGNEIEYNVLMWYNGGVKTYGYDDGVSADHRYKHIKFRDRENNVITVYDGATSQDLFNQLETSAENMTDLVSAAIGDAIDADVDVERILTVLNDINIEANANEDNIAALQTLYVSLWSNTQENPANTSVSVSGTGEDGGVKVEGENGTETIPPDRTRRANPIYTSNTPGSITKGSETTEMDYILDDDGNVHKIADGESVTVDDIQSVNENGEEVSVDSIGTTKKNLQSQNANDISDTVDVFEQSEGLYDDLEGNVEEDGGGAMFSDGVTFTEVLMGGGILVAILYLLQGGNNNNRNNNRRNYSSPRRSSSSSKSSKRSNNK